MSTHLAPRLGASARAAALLGSDRLAPAWLAVPVAAFTTAVGCANGGYLPVHFGWAALVLAWVSLLAVVLRSEVGLSRLELGFAGGFVALLAWMLLGSAWTETPTQTPLEAERLLVYVGAALAVPLLLHRRSYALLLYGVWGGVVLTCGYGLLTRSFPQQLGLPPDICGNRLCRPIGYWNGLGLYAAMGALLALGVVARARSATLRALAAASLVALLPTLYFTFSRGAWIALGFGLLVALALDPRRVQLTTVALGLAPTSAAAVVLASHSGALTRMSVDAAALQRDGRRLLLLLLLLLVLAAAAGVGLAQAETRLRPPPWARRAWTATLLVVVLAVLAGGFAHWGSPPTLARKAYDAFNSPPPVIGQDLNRRFFSFSGSGRTAQWRIALDEFRAHPVTGGGAGSYARWYTLERTTPDKIVNAHSLYLETLGEQGAIGLTLLVATLALPLAAFARARERRLVPLAAGAYAAFLLHAAADWDWQLTGVGVVALACAGAALAAARGVLVPPVERRGRLAVGAAAAAVAAFAALGLLGNVPGDSARSDVRAGRWAAAAGAARTQIRFAPWSSAGWLSLGQSYVRRDPERARRYLRRAVSLDRGNWELWFDLALAERGAPQRRALLEALRLNPRSPEVRDFVARADLGYRLRLPPPPR